MPAAEKLDQQFRLDFHRLVPVHGKSERKVLLPNKLEDLLLVILSTPVKIGILHTYYPHPTNPLQFHNPDEYKISCPTGTRSSTWAIMIGYKVYLPHWTSQKKLLPSVFLPKIHDLKESWWQHLMVLLLWKWYCWEKYQVSDLQRDLVYHRVPCDHDQPMTRVTCWDLRKK